MTANFPTSPVLPGIKPFDNFASNPVKPAAIPASTPVEVEQTPVDKVEIQKTPEVKEEKTGVIQGAKNIIRVMKKFGITIAEYTKGTVKGVTEGFLVGAGIFTGGKILNMIKKHGIDVVDENGHSYKKGTIRQIKVDELRKAVNAVGARDDKELKTIYEAISKKAPKKNVEDAFKISDKALNKVLKKIKLPEKFFDNKEILTRVKFLPVKSLAVLGAIATVGITYWNTSLNANRKKADVDHKYTTTPIVAK